MKTTKKEWFKKICLIGNLGGNTSVSDGGRVKTRLYKKMLEEAGHKVYTIDLFMWRRKIIFIIFRMFFRIKQADIVLNMAGPNGCRILIGLVNLFARKKTRKIFCPLGIGTFDSLLRNLTFDERTRFFSNCEYFNIKDIKMEKNLKKYDLILVQTEILKTCYEKYYRLNNVVKLNNFRDSKIVERHFVQKDKLSIIFCSRVNAEKGILDLIDGVSGLSEICTLDIFGDIQLEKQEMIHFENVLNKHSHINYKGILKPNEVIECISNYDCFVFPTKYHGEGMPGVIIESTFSGIPIISSNFAQIQKEFTNMHDIILFDINNIVDLSEKIQWIFQNQNKAFLIGRQAQQKAKIYTREWNEQMFLQFIIGG